MKQEHYEQAQSELTQDLQNIAYEWQLDFSLKSDAFNDANVTAHHGIIPQDIAVDVNSMSVEEANVYRAIVERYAMQFCKPAVYDVSTGEVSVENGKLKYEAKKLVEQGWKAHTSCKKDEEASSCFISEGDYVVKLEGGSIVEKETTPPKRYTEGTLIKDMASIAKFVKDPQIKEILKQKDAGKKGESGGIGTTATRASIIENLKTRGYIEEKQGKLISTPKAREFYSILPMEIKSATITAKWWLMQQDVAEGKADVNCIQRSVVEVFNAHKDTAYQGVTLHYSKGQRSKKFLKKKYKRSYKK